MAIAEIGQISRGTVIRVLPYGALVRLDDGTLGLVHISEIDEKFVHNVADYLAPEARVIVKVLACKDGGKYEFSIKGAKGEEMPEETEEIAAEPVHWGDPRETRAAFDEKLRDFLCDSGERLSDLKRHNDAKLHRRPR
ncbi:MAG TPA: S1 RNA-binding domain-containing protein [Abditibacterium sp.]|jgi:predicted RNA-binding protein with RPS1 domain